MNTERLLRLSIAVVSLTITASGCSTQGATVGPYPNATSSSQPGGGATPTASPNGGGATPTATPSGGGGATPTATPTGGGGATPTATPTGGGATPTATPTGGASVGPLIVTPDPLNFGLTSILGATMTATISQTGYGGPFTLPANAVVCGGGLTAIPVTATISGSTLTVTLGALGISGTCLITIDGAPGTAGSETVNLAVPLGGNPSPGPFTFTPDPVVFNVLNAVLGATATTTVTEVGYSGAFTLPANAISCPLDILPLSQLAATISGNVITLTTGTLNANIIGTCTVTVDDTQGHSGQFGVNFQVL